MDKAVLSVPREQEVAFAEQGSVSLLSRCGVAMAARQGLVEGAQRGWSDAEDTDGTQAVRLPPPLPSPPLAHSIHVFMCADV